MTDVSLTPVESTEPATPAVPPMWFTVPEFFHAFPLGTEPDERAAAAVEFARELFPEGDEPLWDAAAPFYADLAETMTDASLAYSALGVFSTDEGIAHCSLTVTAVESDHPDPEVAALGIQVILRNDPINDVRWLDLPCGPAVANISIREMAVGPELSASGEETTFLTGQIQVFVPFPTGPYTALVTLDTPAVNYWGEFCELMVAILKTITFQPSEDTQHRDG